VTQRRGSNCFPGEVGIMQRQLCPSVRPSHCSLLCR